MAVYDKLVRDRIPEVINASGKECRFSYVTGESDSFLDWKPSS